MLFQTLVQLNILILATPALAGWSLLPVHATTLHAAGIVWQFRGMDAAPQAKAPVTVWQAPSVAAAAPRPAPVPTAPAALKAVCAAVPASQNPFPHAARAP